MTYSADVNVLLALAAQSQVHHAPARTWHILNGVESDSRVRLLPEPPALDAGWRALTPGKATGANFWTDAYLAAFCQDASCTLVTFDKALARTKGVSVRVLN